MCAKIFFIISLDHICLNNTNNMIFSIQLVYKFIVNLCLYLIYVFSICIY
ncbi:hypothetical protein [Plasmodium yoelii yoelii]|uniref:Uncharacterized protein n=1 Tax=Plasmodium yoelii yoelii TaxID=73239 RepID=Q7RSS7_PLAYO|nr:hypothetical protein [Plasmodium yoelii yoelii]